MQGAVHPKESLIPARRPDHFTGRHCVSPQVQHNARLCKFQVVTPRPPTPDPRARASPLLPTPPWATASCFDPPLPFCGEPHPDSLDPQMVMFWPFPLPQVLTSLMRQGFATRAMLGQGWGQVLLGALRAGGLGSDCLGLARA